MRRVGSSLIELIVVLVIIGVLSGVAVYSFKPNYLRDDISFVMLKIENTRYQAVQYNKGLATLDTPEYSVGCIDLRTLDDTTDTKTATQSYKFHATITNNSSVDVVCFDLLGRLHNGEDDNNATTLESLLFEDIVLTLEDQGVSRTITIDAQTGHLSKN